MQIPWMVFILLMFLQIPAWGMTAIAIVVNKSNPIEDIKLETLANIYKGKKMTWDDGRPIITVNWPSDAQIRTIFYKTVLKSEPSKMFFREPTPIPVSHVIHKTSRGVKRFISHVDRSIGYISLKEVDETVKVLKVDGVEPTEENIRSGRYIISDNRSYTYELDHP